MQKLTLRLLLVFGALAFAGCQRLQKGEIVLALGAEYVPPSNFVGIIDPVDGNTYAQVLRANSVWERGILPIVSVGQIGAHDIKRWRDEHVLVALGKQWKSDSGHRFYSLVVAFRGVERDQAELVLRTMARALHENIKYNAAADFMAARRASDERAKEFSSELAALMPKSPSEFSLKPLIEKLQTEEQIAAQGANEQPTAFVQSVRML